MTTTQPSTAIARVIPDWGSWGLIDLKGNYLIDPIFSTIFDWHDGIARLEKAAAKINVGGQWTNHHNGQYGFINSSGSLITDFSFGDANDFSFGLAAVYNNRKWGFIDTTGQQKIPFQFDRTHSFRAEGCVVQLDDRFGLIDQNGNWKLENIFSDLSDFSFGLSVASIRKGSSSKNEQKFIIDSNGNKVVDLPVEWGWFKPVTENLILIGTSSGFPGYRTYGFMNSRGEVITPPQFYTDSDTEFSTGEFSEDMLAVRNNEQKEGFVNKDGQLSIPLKFDSATPFKNGISKVSLDGRTFYIDKTGRETEHKEPAGPQRPFDEVLPFSEGLAVARKGKFWGVIDESNHVIVNFTFGKRWIRSVGDKGFYFSEHFPKYACGLIGVCEEREDNIYAGYIDRQGNTAIDCKFRMAEPFTPNPSRPINTSPATA